MIIEYYEEFGNKIEHLYKKHVQGYDKYIYENKIKTLDIYDKIDDYLDTLPLSNSTKKNYRTAFHSYIQEIARNYW